MKINFKIIILSLSFCLISSAIWAQADDSGYFTVRGIVMEKYSNESVKDVTVQVNGKTYEVTGYDGSFKVKVRVGDQLVISHRDFQTVYHTIENDDRLLIEVFPQEPEPSQKEIRERDLETFNQLLDSANTYLKNDPQLSVQFIADALKKSRSQSQNAEAYEVLGDLYMNLKQYDLSVTNYRISLQNSSTNQTLLKLGRAYLANKNPNESISTYKKIKENELSPFQKTEYYEGLGDAYFESSNIDLAISTYSSGLKVAENNSIKTKVTDLSSKIAQAYGESGDKDKAEEYFNSSLNTAKKVSKERAVREKVNVAEYNSDNKNYDDEISIRKQVVEEVKAMEKDTVISNDSPLTPQKQNYKIGNALLLNKNPREAINYLDESIAEAERRSDLEVKKDALRKKVDAYVDLGDFDEAKKTYEDFMASVDELYRKKQQDISLNSRLAKSISQSQDRIKSLENERELSKSRYDLSVARTKNQEIIIYSLIVGLSLLLVAAYFTYQYIKQQRLANNLLALKSLRSQMNPHFIFNALNSVNSFIASNDERTANKYLSDFSFLMRAVLENSEEDFIPLQREIELIELYTKLEHFRFKDKFDYLIDIDQNIDIDAYEIPPMLLQPYIENAVWHGLRYKSEKGILKIQIRNITSNEIMISIIDDGIGRERSKSLKTQNQKKHNSRGLSNIKKRIKILNDMYKDKIDVTIGDYNNQKDDSGTKVEVTLKKD